MNKKQMSLIPEAPKQKRKYVKNSVPGQKVGNYNQFPGNPFTSFFDSGFGNSLRFGSNFFEGWITLMPQQLVFAYSQGGLLQRLITTPIRDAMSKGLKITSDQLLEEEIVDLQDFLKRQNFFEMMIRAQSFGDLFGIGFAIIDTGEDDFDKPLTKLEILECEDIELILGNRWDLANAMMQGVWGIQEEDDIGIIGDHINYRGVQVHQSRVFWFFGDRSPAPQYTASIKYFSIYEKLRYVVEYYLDIKAVIIKLVNEAKLDVYAIDGLATALLNDEQFTDIMNKIKGLNQAKNILNAVVVDKDNSYEQKQISFSGLHQLWVEARKDLANASGIPMTKLFGESAAGFASGKEDQANYAELVNQKRTSMFSPINDLLNLYIFKFFGFEVDFSFEFSNLNEADAKMQADTDAVVVSSVSTAYQAGLISEEEGREIFVEKKILKK